MIITFFFFFKLLYVFVPHPVFPIWSLWHQNLRSLFLWLFHFSFLQWLICPPLNRLRFLAIFFFLSTVFCFSGPYIPLLYIWPRSLYFVLSCPGFSSACVNLLPFTLNSKMFFQLPLCSAVLKSEYCAMCLCLVPLLQWWAEQVRLCRPGLISGNSNLRLLSQTPFFPKHSQLHTAPLPLRK